MTELKMSIAASIGALIACFIWDVARFWFLHFWTKYWLWRSKSKAVAQIVEVMQVKR